MPLTAPTVTHLNSGVLFHVARSAYERTASAAEDTSPGQHDALVAIVFSAATLEALIMEVAHFSKGSTLIAPPPYLRALADILDVAESARGSTRLKYLVAKSVLPGEPYDPACQPYQDLDLLFSIRDAIIHLKPDRHTGEPHKLISRLANKRICHPSAEKPMPFTNWLTGIMTRGVARWACNVVVNVAASLNETLVDAPPIGAAFHLRSTLERFKPIV